MAYHLNFDEDFIPGQCHGLSMRGNGCYYSNKTNSLEYFDHFKALDHITLNFNPEGIMALNVSLAFVMFGIALEMKSEHITRLVHAPKALVIGLMAQYVFLPILTLGLVFLLRLPLSISLGMLLVAACPGGNISNYITTLAGGNAALSVSLTAASDLLSIVMTPFLFTTMGNLYIGVVPLEHPIHLSFLAVLKTIFLLTALPIGLGFWFKNTYPTLTKRLLKPIKKISFVLFLLFVIGAIGLNFEHFSQYVWLLLPIVIIHNALAFLTGNLVARVSNVAPIDQKTITIETGIQNSGIALALIFNNHIFPEGFGGTAFIAALWGIWHIVSGMGLALWWGSGR